LLTVVAEQFWSQLIKKLFEGSTVTQSLLQVRNQFGGDIHTAAAALVGKGQDVSRVLVAASAGRAVGTDAGFADLSEGTFDGGPEFFELAKEVLAEGGVGGFWIRHGMYILSHTYYDKKKMQKIISPVFRRH
jgi:hypothetical protein